MGAVAKSYLRKGFLIYEEMCKYLVIMRRPYLTLQRLPSGFPYTVNEKNFVIFFISVQFMCLIEENFENTNAYERSLWKCTTTRFKETVLGLPCQPYSKVIYSIS
jgi:hypothetical protein